MVLPRLHHFVRFGAIGSLVLLSSLGCQQTSDTASTSGSPATAPAVTPSETPTTATPPATSPNNTATAPTTPPETVATAPTQPAAPPPTTAAERSCSAKAFVADTDPAGLNVRGGPGSDFAVVDNLPTGEPVEVSIVGAANGWLLLNEAWSANQQELEQPGWVYAPLLGVTTTSLDINNPDAPASLFAEPDGSASVKTQVPKYTEVTLLNCTGDWLEVDAQGTAGWLAIGDQCSDPTSACP